MPDSTLLDVGSTTTGRATPLRAVDLLLNALAAEPALSVNMFSVCVSLPASALSWNEVAAYELAGAGQGGAIERAEPLRSGVRYKRF